MDMVYAVIHLSLLQFLSSVSYNFPNSCFLHPWLDLFLGILFFLMQMECRSLPFMTWNTSFQALLACKVSLEKSADSLMGTPLQVTVSFPFAASKILSFCLILGNLIMMCASLGPSSLGLYELPGLPGSLFLLPDWRSSPSLFFQISFPFPALPLLLLAPL